MTETEEAVVEAESVVDGLAGVKWLECSICGTEYKMPRGGYRVWRVDNDWCNGCKRQEGDPGWGPFRLYHFGRKLCLKIKNSLKRS